MPRDKINKILDVLIVIIFVYILFFVYIRVTNIEPGLGEPVPVEFQIASFNGLSIATGSLAVITVIKLLRSKNRTASNLGKGIVVTSIASVVIFGLTWLLVAYYALWYILSGGKL